jgi:hypothetical protein
MAIFKNGSVMGASLEATSGYPTCTTLTTMVSLDATDTLELRVTNTEWTQTLLVLDAHMVEKEL